MKSVLLDGNIFNNFPISVFDDVDIVYLSSNFHILDNKNLIKHFIIKGIKYVFCVKRNIENVSLIVRNVESFGKVPCLFYKENSLLGVSLDDSSLGVSLGDSLENLVEIEFFLLKNCEKCGNIRKKIENEDLFSVLENVLSRSFVYCTNECLLNEELGNEELGNEEICEENSLNKLTLENNVYAISSGSTKDKKFQDSMKKEALRLEHAEKREKYKKHMRHISTRKSSVQSMNSANSNKESICKAKTKKGTKCTNKTVDGTDYCGIVSHRELALEKVKVKSH